MPYEVRDTFIGLFLYFFEILRVGDERFIGDFYAELDALNKSFFFCDDSNLGKTVLVLFKDDFLFFQEGRC